MPNVSVPSSPAQLKVSANALIGLHRSRRLGLPLAFLALASLVYGQKPRVAVFDFDERSVSTKGHKVGERLSDALVAKLAGLGSFELLDRQYLEMTLKEQDLKWDARFDNDTAVKIGKMAGASAIIVGTVSAFNSSVSRTESGMMVQKKMKDTGHVELGGSIRLIDIQRNSIIGAISKSAPTKDEVLAESTQRTLGPLGTTSSGQNKGDVQSLLSRLVDRSIDDLAGLLATGVAAKAAEIPNAPKPQAPSVPALSGKVMGIENGLVFFNKGEKDGIQKGMEMAVTRQVEAAFVDPDTGKKPIRKLPVCTLTVSDMEEQMASGKCAGQVPKAGDLVTEIKK